jgi:hypothetical protein
MAKYYVNDNKQNNGDHEVHNENCMYLSLIKSKTDLGNHYFCNSAVEKAKTIYSQSNGCYHCSNYCHTT